MYGNLINIQLYARKGVALIDHRAVENLPEQGSGLEAGGGEPGDGTETLLVNGAWKASDIYTWQT